MGTQEYLPQGQRKDDLIADYVEQQNPAFAGFWLRFAAYLIDSIILFVVKFVLDAITGAESDEILRTASGGFHFTSSFYTSMGVSSFLSILYFSMLESSGMQATLGKKAVGIAVTDLQGQRISFLRALGRYLGKYISALILLIGFIMAGITEKKQALHDLMAGTLVVYK
jgi:uncharacterized RDD family membrane protein YckC